MKTGRLMLFFVLSLFLINTISAIEWDNYKTYDDNTKTVTIRNGLTLGSTIAELQLKTPLDYKVGAGYQKVAEIDIYGYTDYKDFLTNIEFYDRKRAMAQINRDYDFKKKVIVEYEETTYNKICDKLPEEEGYKDCYVANGTITKTREDWVKLTPADFKKNEFMTVGIFTDVQIGDRVEWIPEFMGVRVPEWATWTQDLNVELHYYYTFNETSGQLIDQINGTSNGTNSGTTQGQAGINNNSYLFDGTNDQTQLSPNIPSVFYQTDFSISGWFYSNGETGTEDILFWLSDVDSACRIDSNFRCTYYSGVESRVESSNYTVGGWTHFVWVRDKSVGNYLYINGTLADSNADTANPNLAGSRYSSFGNVGITGRYYNGYLDEWGVWNRTLSEAEVEQLYNNGNSITYDPNPQNSQVEVNLISPTNGTSETTTRQYFYANFTATLSELVNTTLYVWNSSGDIYDTSFTTLSGNFSTANRSIDFLESGNYTWNYEAFNNESDNAFASNNYTIEIIVPPILSNNINLISPTNTFSSEQTFYNFNASLSVVSGNNDNITFYVWNTTNDLVSTYYQALSGNSTSYINYTDSFDIGSYHWNALGCSSNATDSICNYDGSNFTFTREQSGDINVTLGTPINYFNSSSDDILLNSTVVFNFTENNNATAYVWNSGGSLVFQNTTQKSLKNFDNNGFDSAYIRAAPWEYCLNYTFTEYTQPTIYYKVDYDDATFPWPVGYNATLRIRAANTSILETIQDSSPDRSSNVNSVNFTGVYAPGNYGVCLADTGSSHSSEFAFSDSTSVYTIQGSSITYAPDFKIENNKFFWNVTSLSDGQYTWNVLGQGTNSSNLVSDWANANYTFTIDATEPGIVIYSPNGTEDYGYTGLTEVVNFTATDPNLDSCWFEYNSANTSVSCISGAFANSTFSLVNQNNLTVYANDSYGNLGSSLTSWTYGIFENARYYEDSVAEGSIESFVLNVDSTVTITGASLIYNGTSYASNIDNLGGGEYNITNSITIPDFPVLSNASLYWNISTVQLGVIQTRTTLQEVSTSAIDNCGVYTFPMFNLSLYDERTLVPINGTIETAVNLLNLEGGQISNYSIEFDNVQNAQICSNINLTDNNLLYDLELRYYKLLNGSSNYEYVPELYNIQRGSTTNLPQNIGLYDLNVNESTEFTIDYKDNDYIPRGDVLLQIQRKYISEDVYRTVEAPITSGDGSTTAHFDTNSYKYRIIASQNGVILNTFSNIKVACESELTGICNIPLNGRITPDTYVDYETESNFAFTVSQSNYTIDVDFVIPSGELEDVNVLMTQVSSTAPNRVICNQTISSSSGLVSCTANATIGDSEVVIDISWDDEMRRARAYIQEDLNQYYNLNNYIIAAFLMMFLVSMFIGTPIIKVIAGVLSIPLLGFLFLINGSSIGLALGAVAYLVVAAIIIIATMSRREEE